MNIQKSLGGILYCRCCITPTKLNLFSLLPDLSGVRLQSSPPASRMRRRTSNALKGRLATSKTSSKKSRSYWMGGTKRGFRLPTS